MYIYELLEELKIGNPLKHIWCPTALVLTEIPENYKSRRRTHLHGRR